MEAETGEAFEDDTGKVIPVPDQVSEHVDKERLLDQAGEDVVVGAPGPEHCSQGYVDDDKCGRDEGHCAAEEPEPAMNVASEDVEKMVDDAGVAHSSACFRWLDLLRGPAGRARQSRRAAWGRTKEAPTAFCPGVAACGILRAEIGRAHV